MSEHNFNLKHPTLRQSILLILNCIENVLNATVNLRPVFTFLDRLYGLLNNKSENQKHTVLNITAYMFRYV